MNIRHINPSQILNPIETSRSGQSRQTSTPAEFPEELSQALQKGSTVQSPVSEASAGTTQTTTLTPLQLLFGGDQTGADAAVDTAAVSSAATGTSTGTVSTTASGTSSGADVDSTASGSSTAAFDDAYWASQPAAVQQLRTMTDQTQREELGATLTSEGYAIDVPIMIYGWDPEVTTNLREGDGYTWVPAEGQAPIQEAPGIQLGALTPYDPNSPPAGSIQVG